MWVPILILSAIVGFCLPMLPLFYELLSKKDNRPLEISLDYAEPFVADLATNTQIFMSHEKPPFLSILAKEFILFDISATFRRLGARVIGFGVGVESFSAIDKKATSIINGLNKEPLGNLQQLSPVRGILKSNLRMKLQQTLYGDWVVKKSLILDGENTVLGSLKCYQNIYIGVSTIVKGSIFSNENIVIHRDCFIKGPLVSRKKIMLGPNCIIGSPDFPTTIVAEELEVMPGVIVYGNIIAQRRGNFVAI